MLTVSVSYALASPSDDCEGEYVERGFMTGEFSPFTFRTPIDELDSESVADERMRAHDVARLIRDMHCAFSANVAPCWRGNGLSASFYSSEPQETDYREGTTCEQTVHVKGDPRLVRALVRHVKPRHVFG